MMMKVAVVEVPPLTVATGRVFVGAIALLAYSLMRGWHCAGEIKKLIRFTDKGIILTRSDDREYKRYKVCFNNRLFREHLIYQILPH